MNTDLPNLFLELMDYSVFGYVADERPPLVMVTILEEKRYLFAELASIMSDGESMEYVISTPQAWVDFNPTVFKDEEKYHAKHLILKLPYNHREDNNLLSIIHPHSQGFGPVDMGVRDWLKKYYSTVNAHNIAQLLYLLDSLHNLIKDSPRYFVDGLKLFLKWQELVADLGVFKVVTPRLETDVMYISISGYQAGLPLGRPVNLIRVLNLITSCQRDIRKILPRVGITLEDIAIATIDPYIATVVERAVERINVELFYRDHKETNRWHQPLPKGSIEEYLARTSNHASED